MPFTARLAPVAALLLAACAGWEASSTTYAAPPAESPAPSHHVPDAPPASEPEVPPEPEPPAQPPAEPTAPGERVAIASVQLLQNCPDAAPAPAVNQQARASEMSESSSRSPHGGPRPQCEQSTVQLAIHSDRPATFRIDAIRVLDAASKRKAGTTTLRGPSHWDAGNGTYGPWDERIAPRSELQVSYKLGDLDLAQANKLVGPDFDTFSGPFMLELDVSIDGKRRTIRSPEFGREPIGMIQT